MINLIDQQGKFNQKIKQFPNSLCTIAIFGSQSSGKSTLVNSAFGTHFPILNTIKDRRRCTKGVWLQKSTSYNIIDTEGFDSVQRSNDQRIIQRQIALFCLAISDILIVNLWMNQVGRYQGGQVHILKAIIKAANHLIQSQTKTLYFIIKDCTVDANHQVLKQQLQKIVQTIIQDTPHQNPPSIKLNLQFYFMSHFIYKKQQYLKQANALPSTITIKKSLLNQYQPKDKIVYLQHLWNTIISNDGQIDLRVEQQALKIYVTNRIRNQVKHHIQQLILQQTRIGKLNTYERFYQYYIKKSFQQIKLKLPSLHYQKKLKQQFFIIQDQLQHTIQKHFTQVILPNQQKYILTQLLNNKLQTQINSIQLQKIINDLRKNALDYYKVLLKGHKQSVILVKRFAQKITQSSVQYQSQVGHLFNIFQTRLQTQINIQLDSQLRRLKFSDQKLTSTFKKICQQFKYNQWQVNTKQIWQKISHRILTLRLIQKIQTSSSQIHYSIFTGQKSIQIIKKYKQLQKKIQIFIHNFLIYFKQQQLQQQYLQKSKQKIKDILYIQLIKQKNRFRINMLIFGIFLYFSYSQFHKILIFICLKKKNRNYFENVYIFVLAAMIIGSLIKKVLQLKNLQTKKKVQ